MIITLMFSGAMAFASLPTSTITVEETLPESHVVVRAIDRNQREIIQSWVRAGHSPTARIQNKLKEHLLERAASHGSADVFDALLSEIDRAHLSPKLIDSRGTPIIIGLASLANPNQKLTRQYERMIEALLRYSSKEVNATDRAYIGDGRTALHQAAASGNVSLIRTLINHGALVNAKNSSLETPLHLAARFGHIDAVRYLIASGASIHDKTKHTKATPLMAAAEMGHAQVIRLLMATGAKKDEKDTFGKTAPDRYSEYSASYYERMGVTRKKQ